MAKEENYVLYNGYKVYKNGDIISAKGKKISVRVVDGIKVVTVKDGRGGNSVISLGRLIYKLFHHTPDNINSDRKCKLVYIDGDKMNVNAENLYVPIKHREWDKISYKTIKKPKVNTLKTQKGNRFGTLYVNMVKG